MFTQVQLHDTGRSSPLPLYLPTLRVPPVPAVLTTHAFHAPLLDFYRPKFPYSHPNPTPGVDAYLEGVLSLRDALSSVVIVVDDLVAQGIKVVAQLSFKAKSGGREARWTGTAIMEIEDGQIMKTWINTDTISAMIQLGLLQDFMSTQFERTVARTSSGSKLQNLSDADMKVVFALLGRTEAHPTEVLTGNEWLAYFDKVIEEDETNSTASMTVDPRSGLDVVC